MVARILTLTKYDYNSGDPEVVSTVILTGDTFSIIETKMDEGIRHLCIDASLDMPEGEVLLHLKDIMMREDEGYSTHDPENPDKDEFIFKGVDTANII